MTSKSTGPTKEELAWLQLKLTPNLGNRSILRLLERFGTPQAVLSAKMTELEKIPGLRREARRALLQKQTTRSAQDEWRRLMETGGWMITRESPSYPQNLRTIADPPAVLFGRGSLKDRDLVAVAVVGSRFASPTGLIFTERLCMDLAQVGVTIVSGLAIGIDAAAHRGALKGKGRTIAVLGCGLDVPYPRSNVRLREEICENGAVLTEFPLGTPPLAGHFPMRNRIISGLALGVVVVEAAQRSGSLITARLALEQGREVFAVPGMARQYRSVGPHQLLREGAKLVETAEDVLEEIRPLVRSGLRADSTPDKEFQSISLERGDFSEDEQALLKLLGDVPKHIDELCRELRWPVSRVGAMLLDLEIRGVVRQLPGKIFILGDRC